MQNSHTLTRHRDIQNWVSERHGLPAIQRVANHLGKVQPRLAIHFEKSKSPARTPSIDDGVSPVSWNAWLAELERQQLALRVNQTDFEFVKRQELAA